MALITSTMATDVVYNIYEKSPSGSSVITKQVTVTGGTGVTNKVTLVTPEGVTTSVTDTELEALKQNKVFQKHERNGFIKIQKAGKKDTSDMEEKDGSSQLTDEDFEGKGQTPPAVVGGEETEAKKNKKKND